MMVKMNHDRATTIVEQITLATLYTSKEEPIMTKNEMRWMLFIIRQTDSELDKAMKYLEKEGDKK